MLASLIKIPQPKRLSVYIGKARTAEKALRGGSDFPLAAGISKVHHTIPVCFNDPNYKSICELKQRNPYERSRL